MSKVLLQLWVEEEEATKMDSKLKDLYFTKRTDLHRMILLKWIEENCEVTDENKQ